MNTTKVWLVTGASKGLGLTLAKRLLREGHKVAATSRKKTALLSAIGEESDHFLALETDLTDEASVKQAVAKALLHFKRLDVVVNNAGYGIGGAVEELTPEEIKESIDVNLYGTIHVIRAVMPQLRKQRAGHIINISSIAGFAPATGWSVYAASKFAVVGLSEVLAEDVRSLGIKVTVVEPGGFRTQFLTADSLVISKNKIADYTDVHASHERYLAMDGQQKGDPEKAAMAFLQLVNSDNPPVRLFLGSDAYNKASQKLQVIQSDLENWRELIHSTDF